MSFDEFCSKWNVTASERRRLADYLNHLRWVAVRSLLQFSEELEAL